MEAMKLLVIGGVAAGASFAARARRLSEHAQITVLERGPDVSFANCGLPYFIGGEITDRAKLALQTPASLKAMLNIDVHAQSEAVQIDRENKRVLVKNTQNGEESWSSYDRLMLAPGAAPRQANVPGADDERIYALRNLSDMDRISANAKPGMRAVVVGAGFIGLEMVEQLQQKGLSVELVQSSAQVMSQLDEKFARLIEGTLRENQISLRLNTQITEFAPQAEALQCELSTGETLAADIVVMSIGVEPESRLAKEAGLAVGKRGHIVVNEFMQTSDPAIYAAGDVVETADLISRDPVSLPMGGPANRQGRVAADHLFMGEKARPYPGSLGTAIVRVFGTVAGCTGWTETRLSAAGKNYRAVVVNDFHHATYYPGAKHIVLKILWDPETGRLLGGQAVGQEGIDKRLDVLATAIIGNLTIEDLCHLELAYAPPFGSAKDIVNIAGFAATNQEDGLVNIATTFPNDMNVQVVDVRGKAISEASPVAGAINIPMATLRDNLDKLDKSRPILTFCVMGKTSYFAARVLAQHGFEVASLDGGMRVMDRSTLTCC